MPILFARFSTKAVGDDGVPLHSAECIVPFTKAELSKLDEAQAEWDRVFGMPTMLYRTVIPDSCKAMFDITD